jgi:alpha-L-rhamnosidase
MANGLIGADATWIEPVEAADSAPCQRPAYLLAGEVDIGGEVVAAELRITARGIYEAFVNGTRVGDHELTPGYTAYRHRLQVQTFDVTDLVGQGSNALGVMLSDGWWRGQTGFGRRVDSYGSTTAVLAELAATLRSGETIRFGTDDTWRSTASHILAADLIAGEVHDLRRRVDRWAEPGTDRSGWDRVRPGVPDNANLCEPLAPPVRRVEDLQPVSITELAPGRQVVDFGQNSNGWVRLTHLGPDGTEITLTYGEALDADGDVTQTHIAHLPNLEDRDAGSAPFQVDRVVSAGRAEDVFEPRHSTKGFQYVRVEGHPGPLTAADITSVVVHTDLARIGSFTCSDERINRLHRAAEWSFRGNACDIPTDCPTRERAGWTGDWQIYVGTAAYLYDVTGFSAKWLRDVAAEQRPNGAVTHYVPDPHPMDDSGPAFWKDIQGSAGWGDAAVHVPWELYEATGDTAVLTDQWDSMKAWVDFAAESAEVGRHKSRVERSPEPESHEQYLWDTGFHFGEWLEPGVPADECIRRALKDDPAPVATAYLHRSADELAHIATILGRTDDAQHYSELATKVRDAWRREFIVDSTITASSQANLTRALAFGLVPDDLRTKIVGDLVALIRAAGTHLGTGFLATPFLLPVLADHGHLDVAYELLFQDTEPSWLLMLDRGATTIWEEWGGVAADGTPSASLNHYSKGAVISFLHRYVAGVQIVEPGYRRFRVAPQPGGGITRASTHHDSPHGRIDVAWSLTGDGGEIAVTVPPGTSADLDLPDGATETLPSGRHERPWRSARQT